MNLLDKSLDQGVKQITHFMNQCFFTRLHCPHLQVELGFGQHLFEAPSIHLLYITDCWITLIWQFMAENNIQLKVMRAKNMHYAQIKGEFVRTQTSGI